MVPNLMNNGYWQIDSDVSERQFAEVAVELERWQRNRTPVLMVRHATWVPFGSSSTPDAICLYCASANLHTSTHCEKCGAGLVR